MDGRWDRVILHVDMDAFFAAVEILDQPELRGRPVVVGGTGARGVVASCSYEARRFGVRSAMATVHARRLCPEAVFLEGRHERYREVSGELHAIFRRLTPLVEGIGLDEAFLDMSGAQRLYGSPPEMAGKIREQVRAGLQLTCSVGVGRSKMVAKLASRAAKPAVGGPPARRAGGSGSEEPGVVVVSAEEEVGFLQGHRVESLWGVGRVTGAKLRSLGIVTVGQLAGTPRSVLVRHFGVAHGARLAALARGEDDDPVVPDRPTRSIGHERTFARDLTSRAELAGHVRTTCEAVARRVRAAGLAGRTVTVKVRRPDLSTVTRSATLEAPIDAAAAIGAVAADLLASIEVEDGVRLLGVALSSLGPRAGGEQMVLSFDADPGPPGLGAAPVSDPAGRAMQIQQAWHELDTALDAICARFGDQVVGPGTLARGPGAGEAGPGEAPWGPPDPPVSGEGDAAAL